MKRVFIGLIAIIYFVSAFSQQVSTLPEIVSFMSTNDYRHCFKLTNDLDSLMLSTTGVLNRSTCKLLKASILFDHSYAMANQTSFDQATNLCCEIEAELSDLIVWQRIGALCKFTNAMIEDGHPEMAFTASTNLLSTYRYNPCVDVDTNVWDVLFKPGGLNLIPPFGFIKANVAAVRFRMDTNVDITSYTNGLPQEILREIIRR